MTGFMLAIYHFLIASGGVLSVTFPLQRLSTSTGWNHPSYSVGLTAKIDVTLRESGVTQVTSFQEI